MNRFLTLGINKTGRDFVIGDIHGKYQCLMNTLKNLEFDFANDRLIAVGDLIDRGTQNMECLQLIGEPWFYTVIGNHEVMMALALTETPTGYTGKGSMKHWVGNGGMWYYNLRDWEIDELKEVYVPLIMDSLPIGLEFIAENGQRVGITHAGLPNNWTWDETKKAIQNTIKVDDATTLEFLWTRTRVRQGSKVDILGIDLLINGHTPTKDRKWVGNNVFIDQGAYNPYSWKPINVIDLFGEMNDKYKNICTSK